MARMGHVRQPGLLVPLTGVNGQLEGSADDGRRHPTRRTAHARRGCRPFRVNPKTVTRWARAGKITAIRTLGGHRRFRASEIRRCLEQLDSSPRSGPGPSVLIGNASRADLE